MEKVIHSRCFALVLYADSETYDFNSVIDYVKENFEFYAYIKHLPESEETKEHYHLLLYFPNKRTINSLSKELNVPINYFQKANLKPYLKYLIHYDNDDKIQYSVDDVFGPLKDKLIDLIHFNNEENQFSEILLFIESKHKSISWTDLTYFCISKNMYSVYRRNIYALKLLLEEHNRKVNEI